MMDVAKGKRGENRGRRTPWSVPPSSQPVSVLRWVTRFLDCTLVEDVVLGAVTCPSGELVLMDGGYLGLWSGNRSPDDTREPDGIAAVDFEVVGRDAAAAAESFDRQS